MKFRKLETQKAQKQRQTQGETKHVAPEVEAPVQRQLDRKQMQLHAAEEPKRC